jgi:hypothetical protein
VNESDAVAGGTVTILGVNSDDAVKGSVGQYKLFGITFTIQLCVERDGPRLHVAVIVPKILFRLKSTFANEVDATEKKQLRT